jgi:uncharacterized membrane protein
MLWFTRRRIRKLIDAERVEQAIALAELRTSGEIRVSVAPWFWGSVERAADRAFIRLGMTGTREKNGVLFFIVPSRRALVVLGDSGIHARVGQEFWEGVARVLEIRFRRSEFTEGLIEGVEKAAKQLALHFPYDPEQDENELPNVVDIARPT